MAGLAAVRDASRSTLAGPYSRKIPARRCLVADGNALSHFGCNSRPILASPAFKEPRGQYINCGLTDLHPEAAQPVPLASPVLAHATGGR